MIDASPRFTRPTHKKRPRTLGTGPFNDGDLELCGANLTQEAGYLFFEQLGLLGKI